MDESIRYQLKDLSNDDIIPVFKDQFRIGRATTNDLCYANNRYVSGNHCLLEFVEGQLYISDTSSNGTLINRSIKVTKNTPRVQLKSGDVLHLVFRRDTKEDNVAFQVEIAELRSIRSNSPQPMCPFDEDTQIASYPWIRPISPIEQEALPLVTPIKDEKPKKDFAMDAGEDMEDVLTCVCCQDIMTNPITLEPCLHAFCDECYTSWEAVQRTCPKCRVKVIGKKKNVVVNGLLEAYLKAFPHKRPEPKITDKTMQPKYQIGADGMYIDDGDDDDEEMEDDDDDDDDDDVNHVPPPGLFGALPGPLFMPPLQPAPAPAVFRCRQCPGGVGYPAAAAAATTATAPFQCPPGQNHILCQCCLQPMPDRRDEPNTHQHCSLCHQFLCNMYFKPCTRAGCLGCLNPLRDFQFAPRHLGNLVNNNPIETQIVQDYLTHHHMTMQDLFIICCDRLDQQKFHCTTLGTTIAAPSSKVICYKCAVKVFRDLAYQFRAQMKEEEIYSAALRHRQNCHFGKRCRTQFNKIAHAQRFNHACDQTRF